MQRFFLPAGNLEPDRLVELPSELLKHLRTVLRFAPGSECELLDGTGKIALAQITEDYQARILSLRQAAVSGCELSLIQGLPKGDKLELVLQKGTELGVTNFCAVQMTRSVGRFKPERTVQRRQRWERIIQEAARQSGQPYLPQLHIERDLAAAVAAVEADLKLLLWEESGQSLQQVLPKTCPGRIAVLVGPEGGVTAEEVEVAKTAGFQPIGLGPRILRTETAGLAMMAILQYLYGDLANGRSSSKADSQGKDES